VINVTKQTLMKHHQEAKKTDHSIPNKQRWQEATLHLLHFSPTKALNCFIRSTFWTNY